MIGDYHEGGDRMNRPGVQVQIGGGTDPWGFRFSQTKLDKGSIRTLIDLHQVGSQGFNYVKLHGSIEWTDANGRMMIIGTDKEEQRLNFPLLAAYGDLFESILSQSDRLLIMGYSFSDWHINRAIHEAVKQGLKLLIWDTRPLQESLNQWGEIATDGQPREPGDVPPSHELPGFFMDLVDSLIGYVTMPFSEAIMPFGELPPGLQWFFSTDEVVIPHS